MLVIPKFIFFILNQVIYLLFFGVSNCKYLLFIESKFKTNTIIYFNNNFYVFHVLL